ncbi:MAG TPA: FHA domain-containing serine/threonine-protein kinase [Gemmataceae bacterium]|jgi:serine/threonine protein kinase|nr:FHA domain-containing serine/threonine-protein kinase [Gemmataceae bacterium]
MGKRLLVIAGADDGRFYPLVEGSALVIGTSHKNTDVCLHDLSVSRVHCQVTMAGDSVLVKDIENSGGTFVNDVQVLEYELELGDVIRIGQSQLRLEDPDVAPPEAPPPPVEEPPPPAKSPMEQLEELTGQTIGHYEVGPVLGKGHCGIVFRASDLKNKQVVALKVLLPEFPHGVTELPRFIRAMKGRLPLRHPNLVTLYGAGKTGPYCWMALEHVEGESLARAIERRSTARKIHWQFGLRVAVHISRALECAGQHQLAHRNITPSNILWHTEDKVAKLGDLMFRDAMHGSRLQEAILEQKFLAELEYLAPEQTDGDAYVDDLCDLYQLGAVVYALLTGKPPFRGKSPQQTLSRIRDASPVKPTQHQPDIPGPLEAAVLKTLAKRQEDRYQTPAELLADLEELAEQEGLTV